MADPSEFLANPVLLSTLLDSIESGQKHAFVPTPDPAAAGAAPGAMPPGGAPPGYPAPGGAPPGYPAPGGYPAGGGYPPQGGQAVVSGAGGAPPGAMPPEAMPPEGAAQVAPPPEGMPPGAEGGAPPEGAAPPPGGELDMLSMLKRLEEKVDAMSKGPAKPVKPELALSVYAAKMLSTLGQQLGLGEPPEAIRAILAEHEGGLSVPPSGSAGGGAGAAKPAAGGSSGGSAGGGSGGSSGSSSGGSSAPATKTAAEQEYDNMMSAVIGGGDVYQAPASRDWRADLSARLFRGGR